MQHLIDIAKSFSNRDSNSQLENNKRISQKHLINTLNYINFQNETILVNFKHKKYDYVLSIEAKPQPCLGDRLDCEWLETDSIHQKLKSYEFLHFILADDKKPILVNSIVQSITDEGINFELPEICYELNTRKVKRYPCEGIHVEFFQNSAKFQGELKDFSALAFRIEVSIVPPQSFHWIIPVSSVYIVLKDDKGILYSGEYMILRQSFSQKTRTYVLEPIKKPTQRFMDKKYQSMKRTLSSSPNLIFKHPLNKKMIHLEIEDLSGSGFSAQENYKEAVLLPGMIIPELEIEFAGIFRVKCMAQVVNRSVSDDKTNVRCDIDILDMDIQDQVRLSALLHQMTNKYTYVCGHVDMDELWKFFFETGFVYPEKYISIYSNKKIFKETYEKLYIHNPHIAKHFIYQDKGIIKGHISMVRFYENTWLIHHHAARRSSAMTGIVVLKKIGHYINDFHPLHSTHMNFVICYFRPDNKFPNRIFGGCAIDIDDPRKCSIDQFAYFIFQKNPEMSNSLKNCSQVNDLDITESSSEDLLELEGFYRHESGGLLLHALDLESDMVDDDNLSREYEKIGFKRQRHLFSLKKKGDLKAVFMLNISDYGLNLSNFTNCIHVFVLDPSDLPNDMLFSALSKFKKYYNDEFPVLLYPLSYAESQSIHYEKKYSLWILNTQYTDHYFRYLESLFDHAKLKQIKR